MPTEDPKPKVKIRVTTPPDKISLADQYQARDAMHYLLVHGYTNPSTDENSKAMYLTLMGHYGAPTAQKIFNQVSLFNQDNNNKAITDPNERINRFYSTSINDPEVKGIVSNLGGLAGVQGKTGFGYELGGMGQNQPTNTQLLAANNPIVSGVDIQPTKKVVVKVKK